MHFMNHDDMSRVQKLKNRKREFSVFKSGDVFRKNKSMKQKDTEKGIVGYLNTRGKEELMSRKDADGTKKTP